MIRLLNPIPTEIAVACSGGMDSMAVLDFLLRGRKKVTVLHFDHGTPHGAEAVSFVRTFCQEKGLSLHIGRVEAEHDPSLSEEEFWREERYQFFRDSGVSLPLVTAHHLTDAIEWWIFTSLHGRPKIIPYSRPDCNLIRPFLLTSKRELQQWATRNKVPYIEDPSNVETQHMRNFIRQSLLPQALHVNPGLEKTVRKLILEQNRVR